jgi:hypothetical protein
MKFSPASRATTKPISQNSVARSVVSGRLPAGQVIKKTVKTSSLDAYLQFARKLSATSDDSQVKADILQQACTDFGLKGTAGQVYKDDGRILLVSHDQKKCFEITLDGRVKYGGFNGVTCESVNPQIILGISRSKSHV